MSKRNYINIPSTLKLFREGYGLHVQELNFYTLRIMDEESDKKWDWFHTKGTLCEHKVVNYQNQITNIGRYLDDEQVAILIKKRKHL